MIIFFTERDWLYRPRGADQATGRRCPPDVRPAAAQRPRSGHRYVELGRWADSAQRPVLRRNNNDRLRLYVQEASVSGLRQEHRSGDWCIGSSDERFCAERRLRGGDCWNSVRGNERSFIRFFLFIKCELCFSLPPPDTQPRWISIRRCCPPSIRTRNAMPIGRLAINWRIAFSLTRTKTCSPSSPLSHGV